MYTPISNYKIVLIPITFTTANKHMLLEEQVIAVKLKKKPQRCLIGKTTYFFFGEVGCSWQAESKKDAYFWFC